MKKLLKIKFVDFWKNFDSKDNHFYNFLNHYYDVQISDEPDYLFFSVYGYEHLNYKQCVKILFTGENMVPDFNFCDYALGFHFIDFDDRYMRYPLYVIYDGFEDLKNDKKIDKNLAKRKFCNFVYSNSVNADPCRNYFFEELSKYKKVDSGGRYKNNVGGPVKDKMEFIKDYKFTIAFENSASPGYTTEKIMEPMRINSIPVYYGNPLIDRDFNPESFIWVKDKKEIDKIIQEIIRLDQDEEAYLEKLRIPWMNKDQQKRQWNEELLLFFKNIFDKEIEEAKKISPFGFTDHYIDTLKKMDFVWKKQLKKNALKAKLKNVFKK